MYKSEQGVTLVELLITMAIVSVILAGAYSSFLSSSKRLVLQNDIVEMQTEARAAMDFMVRELRLAYGVPIDSGCSSGSNTTTTLKDTSKNWSASPPFNTSYYVPPFDPSYYVYYVRIISGTGQGQARSISSNTSTQLTIASPWSTTPNNTSCNVIISSPSISTRVTTNDTIRFYRLEDAGYSSCTTTTLNDTTKHWSTFDGPSSYTVRIISGTGARQTRTLSSNTSTQLTVSSA